MLSITNFKGATWHLACVLVRSFYAVQHNPSLPINAYISAMMEKKSALTALGIIIDDMELKDILLMNLNDFYSATVRTIFTQATEPTLEQVKTLLCASAGAECTYHTPG